MTAWADAFNTGSYPSGWADAVETNGTVTPTVGGLVAVTTTNAGKTVASRSISTSANVRTLETSVNVAAITATGTAEGYIAGFRSTGWVGGSADFPIAWIDYKNGTGWRLGIYDDNTFGAKIVATFSSPVPTATSCLLAIEIKADVSPIVVNGYLDGVLVATVTATGTGTNGIKNIPTSAVLGVYEIAGAWGPNTATFATAAFSESGFVPPDVTPPVVSGAAATYLLPTAVVIGWTSDEVSVADRVKYSLSPYNAGTALTTDEFDSTSFGTGGRSVGAGGLLPSTAYQFIPVSEDIAGNVSADITPVTGTTIARRTGLVCCAGDSLTAGQGVAAPDKWTTLLQTDLSTTAWVFNFGIGGTSNTNWDPTTNQRLINRFVTIANQGTGKNILCFMASGNGGNTVGEYNAYVAAITAAINAGFTVIGSTVPPRTVGGSYNAINTPLRANWQAIGLFSLIDIETIPDLTDPSNTTYYSDGTHWTAAGDAVYEPYILAQVQLAMAATTAGSGFSAGMLMLGVG